jgi:hypothetical protein
MHSVQEKNSCQAHRSERIKAAGFIPATLRRPACHGCRTIPYFRL